jgi:tetratricopeptide (TPR) repeat protein/two-component sensor histidine kinase
MEWADHRAVMGRAPGAIIGTLLLSLFVLFAACGGGDVPPPFEAKPDTLAYVTELADARGMLNDGRLDEGEMAAQAVYNATRSNPGLSRQEVQALSLLGLAQQRRHQNDSALALYREGLRVAEEYGDTAGMSTAWLNIGVALQRKGDYDASLEAALKALQLKEAIGDENGAARVMNNLSNLYWRQNDRPAAIAMLLNAIGIKRNLHDSLGLSNSLNGLAALLVEDGRPDTAVVLLHESMAIQRSVAPEAELYAQLVNLGLAFHEANETDSALHYYRQGMHEAQQSDDPAGEVHALYGMAEVLMDQGQFREAGPLLDSSLAIAERIGSKDLVKEAHISLVRQREAIGEVAAALKHFRRYHHLSDSLMNAEKDATMSELRVRYDAERKERENDELRAAQELFDLRAERNRWIAIGIGVLTLAGGVFTWATVQRNRNRARQREAELEQQALRLQMDPHFLFNALNTVPGLYASGDAMVANDHVGHLSRFLRLVLETSRRRAIPLQQEIELVEHYLRISANRKPGSFTWEVKVMPNVQAERVAIPPMLIQPLVENAIEHGFNGQGAGRLSVVVDRTDSVLHIEVKDNGVGRSAAAERPSRHKGNSMGIDLVRKRLALFDKRTPLKDAVEVRDDRDANGVATGTTVILRLRVQNLSEHAAAGDH